MEGKYGSNREGSTRHKEEEEDRQERRGTKNTKERKPPLMPERRERMPKTHAVAHAASR